MIGTILQRMIFWELTRVFALAWLGLTGLFLLGGVVQEASQRGLTPPQILVVIPLLVPSTMPYTVPATVLFACCVVYGRMAHDHEITALRAAGVHLGRLLAPAVVFSVLIAIGLTVLQSEVVPRSRQMLADRVVADVDALIYSMLKRTGCIRNNKLDFSVYVREVRGKQLIDPVIKRRGTNGYSVVAHAREATLTTDLTRDMVYIDMPHCTLVGNEIDGSMRDQRFDVSFPASSFRDTAVRPMNMTREQIDSKWDELRQDRAQRQDQLDLIAAQLATLPDPPPKAVLDLKKDNEFHVKDSYRVERLLWTESNLRPALAFGCLCFALVAVPVGIQFHRADFLSAFVSCFLPVVLIYYPLLLAGTNLAREGRVPAHVSVWVADVVAATVGALMLRRLFSR